MSRDGRAGVLPVDKPAGPSSHDVVARARRSLGVRRVGHTGTLDPFASGLMLLCVGSATRIAEQLTGLPKTYEAVARLGESTDTLDREGTVVATSETWRAIEPAAVERAGAALVGSILQVPPQFSAKKVEGVRMYRRARAGEQVALEPRRVTVHALEILEMDLPHLRLRVTCSAGTYVRALARDLGEALGTGAHLVGLRRTAVGEFSVDRALAMEDLDVLERVRDAWITPLAALAHLPRVDVDQAAARALGFGQAVELDETRVSGTVAVAWKDELVALGEVRDRRLRPRKVFTS